VVVSQDNGGQLAAWAFDRANVLTNRAVKPYQVW
jgi:hypothetical protein